MPRAESCLRPHRSPHISGAAPQPLNLLQELRRAQEAPRPPPRCPALLAQVPSSGLVTPGVGKGLQVLKASTGQPAISRMILLPSPACCDAVYPPCLSHLCSPRC